MRRESISVRGRAVIDYLVGWFLGLPIGFLACVHCFQKGIATIEASGDAVFKKRPREDLSEWCDGCKTFTNRGRPCHCPPPSPPVRWALERFVPPRSEPPLRKARLRYSSRANRRARRLLPLRGASRWAPIPFSRAQGAGSTSGWMAAWIRTNRLSVLNAAPPTAAGRGRWTGQHY